jgi:hypothetical protein
MSQIRRLSLVSLLFVAGCGAIHLAPPEGRSLEERRRTLDEVPPARQKAAESAPADGTATGDATKSGGNSTAPAGEGTGSAAVAPAAATPSSDEAADAAPKSMKDAKALDDPELGIRLPLGIPTLKAGNGNRD